MLPSKWSTQLSTDVDAVTKSIRIRRVQTAIRKHVYVTKGF